MSRHLIYVAFWENELETLIEFLKEQNYTPSEVANMELILNKARNHENV